MPRHIGFPTPHSHPTEGELESRRDLRRSRKDQTKLFKSLLDPHRFLLAIPASGLETSVSERDRVKASPANSHPRAGNRPCRTRPLRSLTAEDLSAEGVRNRTGPEPTLAQ